MSSVALEPAADCEEPLPSPRAWLWIGARVAFFSAIVGLVLNRVNPRENAFVESLVFSECIGLAIYGCYAITRFWGAPRRRRSGVRDYVMRGVFTIPIGLVVGLQVGAWLMGRDVDYAVLVRTAIFSIPITIVATASLMYYFWSNHRISDAAAASSDAERMIAEARLKLLQTQVEPHMLFNTLANLRSLVDVDPQRAQTMIDALIVYLRGTLAASRNTTVPLADEFAQLGAYLALMRVRMAERLHVAIDLPDALRAWPAPPMLLQPLVENAIKHGIEPKIEGGTVSVSATVVGDRVRFDVEDDGVGLDQTHASGYGLTHVRERLRLLYGDAATVACEPREAGGVRVRIEVPR